MTSAGPGQPPPHGGPPSWGGTPPWNGAQPWGGPAAGHPPPPGRAPGNRRGAVIGIGVAVLVLAGFVGYRVYDQRQDERIADRYSRIHALEKGKCFVPGGGYTDDRAIRETGSCTDPESSQRVTSTVSTYGSCPTGYGNGFLSTTRNNGTYGDRSVCLSTNLFLGRCYQQADTPTLLALVDCTDARNNTAGYEVVIKRLYRTDGSKDACGEPPLKTYLQPDREGVTCSRVF